MQPHVLKANVYMEKWPDKYEIFRNKFKLIPISNTHWTYWDCYKICLFWTKRVDLIFQHNRSWSLCIYYRKSWKIIFYSLRPACKKYFSDLLVLMSVFNLIQLNYYNLSILNISYIFSLFLFWLYCKLVKYILYVHANDFSCNDI